MYNNILELYDFLILIEKMNIDEFISNYELLKKNTLNKKFRLFKSKQYKILREFLLSSNYENFVSKLDNLNKKYHNDIKQIIKNLKESKEFTKVKVEQIEELVKILKEYKESKEVTKEKRIEELENQLKESKEVTKEKEKRIEELEDKLKESKEYSEVKKEQSEENEEKKKLIEKIEKIEKERENYLNDYNNLKSRIDDEQQELLKKQKIKILLEVLEIYEYLMKFSEQIESEKDKIPNLIFDNFKIIKKFFNRFINDYEIDIIDSSEKYNEKIHTVVQVLNDENSEDMLILNVLSNGYKIKDEVIKKSRVIINKKIEEGE